MRYLGIDYGSKRLGLAICDPSEVIVSPLCLLQVKDGNHKESIQQIKQIIQEQEADAVVVGLPLNMDDTEGPQAKLTRRFADQLAQALSIPVHLQDERLSSSSADEKLNQSKLSAGKRKARRDMLAACEILQEFLDQHQR